MTPRECRLVDAFTWDAYAGNAAGVLLDAAGLTDRQMQRIAREFNASETTFIMPAETDGAALRFRWFTPQVEVTFCGHATLAAAHALLECGRFERELLDAQSGLRIASAAGVLAVRATRSDAPAARTIYWLDAPDPRPRPSPLPAAFFADLLGLGTDELDPRLPPVLTADRDVILGVAELPRLLQLEPDFARLREAGLRHRFRGLCVTTTETLSRGVACHSRFFAPAAGINEDPVTGSVHGPLAARLVEIGLVPLVDGVAAFQCAKGSADGRAGIVRAVVTRRADGCHVRIGGACVTTMQGILRELPRADGP